MLQDLAEKQNIEVLDMMKLNCQNVIVFIAVTFWLQQYKITFYCKINLLVIKKHKMFTKQETVTITFYYTIRLLNPVFTLIMRGSPEFRPLFL